MMKMLVEGIMNAELPWGLILIGVFIAIVVEIIKVPVMPFAVGMYLPFSLSAGIMAGGAVRFLVEKIKGTDRRKESPHRQRRALHIRTYRRRRYHRYPACRICSCET